MAPPQVEEAGGDGGRDSAALVSVSTPPSAESPSITWDAHQEQQQPPKKKRKSKANKEHYDVADMLRCLRGSGVATEKMVREVYCDADSVGPTSENPSSCRHHFLADLNSTPPEDTCHAEEQASAVDASTPTSPSASMSPSAVTFPSVRLPELSAGARHAMRVTMLEQQHQFAEQVKMLHKLVGDQKNLCKEEDKEQEEEVMLHQKQGTWAAHLLSKGSEAGQVADEGKATAGPASNCLVVSPRGSMSSSTCSLPSALELHRPSASGSTKGSAKGGVKRRKHVTTQSPQSHKSQLANAAGKDHRDDRKRAKMQQPSVLEMVGETDNRSRSKAVRNNHSLLPTRSSWAPTPPVAQPIRSALLESPLVSPMQQQRAPAPPAPSVPRPSLATDMSLPFSPTGLQASPFWQFYGAWAAAGGPYAGGNIPGNQVPVPGSSWPSQAMTATMQSTERTVSPMSAMPSRSGYTQGHYYNSQNMQQWRHPPPPPPPPSSAASVQQAAAGMRTPSPLPSAPQWNSLWAYTAGLRAGRMISGMGPPNPLPLPSAEAHNGRMYSVPTEVSGHAPSNTSNLYYRMPHKTLTKSVQDPLATFKAPPPMRLFHDDRSRQHLVAIDASSPGSN